MREYQKIQTIFKRDEKGHILLGDWSLPEFEYLQNNIWTFTEKVDGTNIRVIWNGENIIFAGKTDKAQIPAFLLQRLQEIFNKKQIFQNVFPLDNKVEVCLYGEGYGKGIQKGENYIKDGVDFILFDILIGNIFLKREDIEDIALRFGIKVVPVVKEGTLNQMIDLVKNGFNSAWGDFIAEGIVARPKVELRDRRGFRVITKLKNKDFKIKEVEEVKDV